MPKSEDRPIEIQWDIDPEGSERTQAVQIGMALLFAGRVCTWSDLIEMLSENGPKAERLRKGLNVWDGRGTGPRPGQIDPDRLRALDAFGETLSGIRRPAGNARSFPTSVMECPACHRWGFLNGSTPPKACPWTRGCTGNPVKITPSGTEIRLI